MKEMVAVLMLGEPLETAKEERERGEGGEREMKADSGGSSGWKLSYTELVKSSKVIREAKGDPG